MSRPTPLLRSINIQLDMEHPERIAHFWPTAKSVGLVSSIARARAGHALFVVAPYGSGKSIAASYAGHLVNNEPGSTEALRRVEHRLAHVDPELAQWVRERREGGPRGLFVPLYGKASSAARALQDGLASAFADGRRARPVRRVSVATARDVDHLLRVSAERARAWKRDRIVLVWDEFGRHLQGLVSEGRPEELDVLQVLAEVVSRPSAVPVTLVLLLHRSLLGYAAALPSGARKEWAKIEGRFETLQYVDDSAELYELVGSLVGDVREAEPGRIDFGARAVSAKRAGLFSHMDVDRLERCLARAWPLTATTLYLLPRVAARVAQSERSVFSFLQGLRLGETHRSGPVRPGAIYDYFGGDFRADGGPGGTHRPWLEAESARSKVPEGSQADEALKAAFLLSLGLAGERGRATRDQLLMALEEGGDDHSEGTLDELVQRNLLVHRRHSDQLVVWHGTDADVRGRLQEERKRGVADFELASFLATEFPPPVWRPVEYNARHAIRRYCVAEYMTVAGLERFLDALALHRGREPGTDGQMLYILPANPQEEARARELACGVSDDRLFLAVAPESSALTDAALDLWYLLRLQADSDLLSLDPLVGAELEHLADDARTGLGPMVDRVVRPQNEGSAWFYRGEEVGLQSAWALRRLLSEAMTKIFRSTPVIHSEMVVRRRVSPVVANARKKVALGILERCGQEDVGIEGNYADRAIFRSVFVRTGLYRRQGDTWALAQPEQIPGGGGDFARYGIGSGAS